MASFLDRLLGRRVPVTEPAGEGIGMFTGHPVLPQDPRRALAAQVLPTMSGDAGVRLAASTNRTGRYFGTDIVPPVRFPLTGPPRVNRPTDFEVAALKSHG